MINISPSAVVFNVDGERLSRAVEFAFEVTLKHTLLLYKLDTIDVSTVTTRTNIRGAFAKFVLGRVLNCGRVFDRPYVENALACYLQKTGHLTKEMFDRLLFSDEAGSYSYKASYAVAIRVSVGVFLVALHSSAAITLPATFPWPSLRDEQGSGLRRLEIGKYVASELLAFVRMLDSQSETLPHPAFQAVGGDQKRREWFLSYATKLLLATGWHKPEDANVGDLLSIKAAERIIGGKSGIPLAYSALLDVLNLAFPGRIRITSEQWAEAVKTSLMAGVPGRGTTTLAKALQHLFQEGPRSDYDLIEEVLALSSAWGRPPRLKTVERLPGIDANVRTLSKVWLDLEELFVRKNPRESYRPVYNALGWWNVYLFFYLPYWFDRNRCTSLVFPSTPSLLLRSVFVSRLLSSTDERPVTFIEFMNSQAERRGWANNSYYGTLLQLQNFFEFIERYSEEMPGCEGFAQPLSDHDYPRTSRAAATKKQPVPRRFFAVYLDYHEALIAHHRVVTERVLRGELTSDDVRRVESNGNVIDTFATSGLVGFIPVLFTSTTTLPLQFIPNVLDTGTRTLKDGRTVSLPHPHSLHQNLVALHTGVRHNHIQWLDKDRFDERVDEADSEFTLLYVNTDKQKNEPWTPHVNIRVIELLRAQRGWCDLIGEPEFHQVHFYNDNPDTKWAKIKPLFAYTAAGKPHSDKAYTQVWQDTLCGLQGLMPDLPEFGRSRVLLRLLPPGHKPGDGDLANKLEQYGAQFKMGDACPVRVTSLITPHSARIAVVSQYITFLPADLIGKFITGQKKGVVPYYVHLDQETIQAEQAHQAARMRDAALRGAFEPVLSRGATATTFVHADKINSNLARSLRSNLEETITAHGGMSISFGERAMKGIDVLREKGVADVAFNKTEVCPYGNNCPPEVVKELKGMRRCGACPYAVRFIDHLPALLAKKRQVAETVDELESVLATDARTLNAKYTAEELDTLEAERSRLCEDLAGWTLSEEVLEVMRQRIAKGQDTRTWTVQRPEVIERDLRRVAIQTTASEYLLARLGESIAFPTLESPQVRARFDLLRRELLARAGRLREAFSSGVPVDPAGECAGLLKTVVAATGKNITQIAKLLENDVHMSSLPEADLRLLEAEEGA